MKFFIDSANINEIKEAVSLGMCDGVTTNPSLVAKEGRKFDDVVREILEIVDGPVSLEVVSMECKGMVNEAKKLAKLSENVVIKIPMCTEGLKATKILARHGYQCQRDPDIFAPPVADGGQGGRGLREPLRGQA